MRHSLLRKKTTYATDFKIAIQLGLVSRKALKVIPKSTLSNIRHSDLSHIYGLEYSEIPEEVIRLIKSLMKKKKLLKIYKAYYHLKTTIISIFSQIKNIKPYLRKYKKQVVTAINKVRDTISLKNACRFFRISKALFHSWVRQVNYPCPSSSLDLCRHRWVNQITIEEERKLVDLLHDPFYKGWAVYQIIIHAQLTGKLFISVGTAYKYIKVHGLGSRRIRKKKQKQGIRTSHPNEVWHMDVTLYKTIDGITAYIYILMDNFSRFILNWEVKTYLAGHISLSMVREARELYLPPEGAIEVPETMLLVDGGPENNNKDMDEYLVSVPIRKFVAQKDIVFSNSMVEAVNKKLKYQHLFPFNHFSYKELIPHLIKQISEYNSVRTHHAHKYCTPQQVYFGDQPDLTEVKDKMEKARKQRIIKNLMVNCPACS